MTFLHSKRSFRDRKIIFLDQKRNCFGVEGCRIWAFCIKIPPLCYVSCSAAYFAGAFDKSTAKLENTMANSIGTVSDSELLLIASQVWEVLDASTAEYPGVTGPQVDDLNTFKIHLTPTLSHTSRHRLKPNRRRRQRKLAATTSKLSYGFCET